MHISERMQIRCITGHLGLWAIPDAVQAGTNKPPAPDGSRAERKGLGRERQKRSALGISRTPDCREENSRLSDLRVTGPLTENSAQNEIQTHSSAQESQHVPTI